MPGVTADEPIRLPTNEYEKFHRILRLASGDEILVLPNDGTAIRCRYQGKTVVPIDVFQPETELPIRITVVQALPKGDKLDEIIRSCAELGVQKFVLFASDRSVVKWDQAKLEARIKRLETIAAEACEVAFRTHLPSVEFCASWEAIFDHPYLIVLSEAEGISAPLSQFRNQDISLLVGPEGGWSPRERERFKGKEVTLGPRVLRVDHAAAAAVASLVIP